MQERLFTAYQVADLIGSTPGVVARWIQTGRLAAHRLDDGSVRVSEVQLQQFLGKQGFDIKQVMTKAMRVSSDENAVHKKPISVATDSDETPDEIAEAIKQSIEEEPAEEQQEVVDLETADESPGAVDGQPDDDPPGEAAIPQASPADEIHPEQPADEQPTDERPANENLLRAVIPQVPPTDEAPKQSADDQPVRETVEPVRHQPQHISTAEALADAIVQDSVDRGATAIHLEAIGNKLSLRLRLGGAMQESNLVRKASDEAGLGLISRFKSLAGVGGDSRGVQTGEFQLPVEGREITLRLSFVPRLYGDGVVLRIFDPSITDSLEQMALSPSQTGQIRTLLAKSYGLVLLACPPRNGAKNMLRAMIAELSITKPSILFVERSADSAVDGVTQCVCDAEGGFGWADAISAAADQDCDAVVAEEISEPDSVAAAVKAASDDCMILAGVRADTEIEAIGMMRMMGAKPWPLASALVGVVAQRTVRTLCNECKRRELPAADMLERLGIDSDKIDYPIYAPVGCDKCHGGGYAGGATLMSIFTIDEVVRELIRKGESNETILQAADGSLLSEGLAKLRGGETSLEELVRVRLR